jgi:hypothetical protein
MAFDDCALTDCLLIAERRCERCQRPHCRVHARWEPSEFTLGRLVITTFEFVCFACLPHAAEQEGEEPPNREHAARRAS